MVRAVVFDLFETLLTVTGTQPTRASSVGAALGLEREPFRVEWKARRPHVVSGRLSPKLVPTGGERLVWGRGTGAIWRCIRSHSAVWAGSEANRP
jgi:hypothetical protein